MEQGLEHLDMAFEEVERPRRTGTAIPDYLLRLGLRPVRVGLRLLADPGAPLRSLLVQRLP